MHRLTRRAAHIVLLFLCVCGRPIAAETDLPRWVSLRADEVNMRTGPGENYPIDWIYHRKDLPIEVIAELGHWRHVRDMDGTIGWMHKSMLSGSRTALVRGQTRPMRSEPSALARPVAQLEPGVVVHLESCREDWCRVSVPGRTGWLRRSEIWGVYPDERIE